MVEKIVTTQVVFLLANEAVQYALKGQPARSPGQSEAAPWVMITQQRFRPARAKAYI